jgi:hypothetical protein
MKEKFNFMQPLAKVNYSVNRKDMSESMTEFALRIAVIGVEDRIGIQAIAEKIRKEFNEYYGPDWICFVCNDQMASNFNPFENTTIFFIVKGIHIILFKPNI